MSGHSPEQAFGTFEGVPSGISALRYREIQKDCKIHNNIGITISNRLYRSFMKFLVADVLFLIFRMLLIFVRSIFPICSGCEPMDEVFIFGHGRVRPRCVLGHLPRDEP